MAVTEVYEFVVVPADVLHGHETGEHNSQGGPIHGTVRVACAATGRTRKQSGAAEPGEGEKGSKRFSGRRGVCTLCVCARTVSIWLTAGSSTPRSIMRCTARSAI